MKKAELEERLAQAEERLAQAEETLKAIIEICNRSGDDVLKKFNDDSMERIGKSIYNQSSVYPLKTGMIESQARWYFVLNK